MPKRGAQPLTVLTERTKLPGLNHLGARCSVDYDFNGNNERVPWIRVGVGSLEERQPATQPLPCFGTIRAESPDQRWPVGGPVPPIFPPVPRQPGTGEAKRGFSGVRQGQVPFVLSLSQVLADRGSVPKTKEELLKNNGVGHKVAAWFLACG